MICGICQKEVKNCTLFFGFIICEKCEKRCHKIDNGIIKVN